jgi:hypothetical protein
MSAYTEARIQDIRRAQHLERAPFVKMTDQEKREANRVAMAKWRAANPERNRAAQRVAAAKWRAANPERSRAVQRAVQRKARGAPIATRPVPEHCENCGRLPNGQGGTMHLDHDHKTGKFRGWLCQSCNVGLGHLGDSIASLQSAIAYLIRNESS